MAQRHATVPLLSRDRTLDPSDYGGHLTERDLHPFRRCSYDLRARGGVWSKLVLDASTAPVQAAQPLCQRAQLWLERAPCT